MVLTLGGRLRAAIHTRLSIVALAAAMATLGGCATSGGMATRRASNVEPSGLIVQNNSWNQVTVYLLQGGARLRVGEVAGFSTQVFPGSRLGMMTGGTGTFLVARPLAGTPFRSENLMFTPGRMLVWTIENQPAHSYLSLR